MHLTKQSIGLHLGFEMFFEGISYNCPALKLFGYAYDSQLKRAISRKVKQLAKNKP